MWGFFSVLSGDGGEKITTRPRGLLWLETAALCLSLPWALFLNEGCEEVGKFQRLASGKDPAHSVETLGGSSAERGLPVNSASAEERRAGCRLQEQSEREGSSKTRHGLRNPQGLGV